MKKNILRQGDVLFIELDEIESPAQAVPASNERGKSEVIVARGEFTGHAHVLDPKKVEMFEGENFEAIKVDKPTKLEHEEHSEILFNKGVFEIVRPYNYTPERLIRDLD